MSALLVCLRCKAASKTRRNGYLGPWTSADSRPDGVNAAPPRRSATSPNLLKFEVGFRHLDGLTVAELNKIHGRAFLDTEFQSPFGLDVFVDRANTTQISKFQILRWCVGGNFYYIAIIKFHGVLHKPQCQAIAYIILVQSISYPATAF